MIRLDTGDGPMEGCFLAEGGREPTPFCGWMELLALLEAARRPAPAADDEMEVETR